ncbi:MULTISPECIES: bifunctional 2-polyprenyl-6-hydroxyphenol methylase/3-demethylubiquinol 3-O-methyltransferase UbiG [Kosakonia]|jgi:2-polyprenyl-3-methyl-5-hydroxy-6-metoxy-1,4-benzoquinol methylase|uniref:class I SAM-dependent methyltransferase n=1 Tax=Kosakonia TaxID=1330547 RepID=UPI00034AE7E6|nr:MULTISPECIES: class I SAM-dependent methyltransferase [Kosakonia]AST69914.1 SAM-dependent methyltransferase [Kosakonia cowanii]AZI87042.1 class I SAM-dependent methyltransferase [Kosakonia sp. CCTCC M2018092]
MNNKNFNVAGGQKEDGIVFGNTFDKYGSKNPVVKWMMNGFDQALSSFVGKARPTNIHEIGCGEGFWVNKWNASGLNARGCDFSTEVINIAKANASASNLAQEKFSVKSIYDLDKDHDAADLIVCCEVLEHLEDPQSGIRKLSEVAENYVILSVPREPIWCALNMLRGKYLSSFGNTPGHLQHWSKKSFLKFVGQHFDIVSVASPFPWTMVLCQKRKDR